MSYGYVTNRSKELVLYGEPGYRVLRTVRRRVLVQREVTCKFVSVGVHLADRTENEEKHWQTLTELDHYYYQYSHANRSLKLELNRAFGEKGKVWIQRWKTFVVGERWKVRCDDWDGQGTLCPLQREMKSGEIGCPVRFFAFGYSGIYPPRRPLPGVCDGPLNWSLRSRITAPRCKDEHGFNMQHLAMARHEVDKREKSGKRAT